MTVCVVVWCVAGQKRYKCKKMCQVNWVKDTCMCDGVCGDQGDVYVWRVCVSGQKRYKCKKMCQVNWVKVTCMCVVVNVTCMCGGVCVLQARSATSARRCAR